MPAPASVPRDEEAPGAVGLDSRAPAEVAAARTGVVVGEVAEDLTLVVGELLLGLVVGKRPDVGAAGERVRHAQDAGEGLDGALARLLLDLLPVRDRAALGRKAERVGEAGGRDQRAQRLVVARPGRRQEGSMRLGDGGRQAGRW